MDPIQQIEDLTVALISFATNQEADDTLNLPRLNQLLNEFKAIQPQDGAEAEALHSGIDELEDIVALLQEAELTDDTDAKEDLLTQLEGIRFR